MREIINKAIIEKGDKGGLLKCEEQLSHVDEMTEFTKEQYEILKKKS